MAVTKDEKEAKMTFLAYAEMNIIAIIVCAIVIYFQRHHDTRVIPKKMFILMLIQLCIVLFADTASRVIIYYTESHTEPNLVLCIIHTFLLAVYNLIQCSLPMTLLKCCIVVGGGHIGIKKDILISVPLLLTIVFIVVNIISPVTYAVDESGAYSRLPFFEISLVIPCIYVVLCFAWALYNYFCWKGGNMLVKKRLLIFASIIFIGTALSAAFYELGVWPIAALAVVYLFVSVQNTKNAEAAIEAFRDSLTNLKNAASYRHYLFKLDERIADGRSEFGVVVMDVTGLKNVNDAYGHDAGDRLLILAAKYICDVFKHSPVFRVGGDEFVAILEGEDYANRLVLVESFLLGMSKLRLFVGDGEVPVEIAIGLAIHKEEKEMLYADVFKLADRRMYEHKKSQKSIV